MPHNPPTPVITNASAQELDQDVLARCTQCLLYTNLAGALLHRHQHDVHQANARNSQRQRSDKRHQHLQSSLDNTKLRQLL